MGHFSTANVLVKAGADPHTPDGLFRNIWDPEELRNLVKNCENYTDPECDLILLLHEAAYQFSIMGQLSNAYEMNRRAREWIKRRENPPSLAVDKLQ